MSLVANQSSQVKERRCFSNNKVCRVVGLSTRTVHHHKHYNQLGSIKDPINDYDVLSFIYWIALRIPWNWFTSRTPVQALDLSKPFSPKVNAIMVIWDCCWAQLRPTSINLSKKIPGIILRFGQILRHKHLFHGNTTTYDTNVVWDMSWRRRQFLGMILISERLLVYRKKLVLRSCNFSRKSYVISHFYLP